MKSRRLPKSLIEAIRYFADPDVCVDFIAQLRWPNGVECPHCHGERVSYLRTRRIWKCMDKSCHKQFSVKTQSVFEDSPIALDRWLTAVWLVVNCKNGISSYEIARDLKITQKSAWFMLHRIRLALKDGNWSCKIGSEDGGPVEVDETFVGPDARKMHRARRLRSIELNGTHGKAIVMGMLERESRRVRATVIPNVKRETLQNQILNHIEKGSTVYTDRWPGYDSLAAQDFVHETVTHLDEYVRGQRSTPRGLRTSGACSSAG